MARSRFLFQQLTEGREKLSYADAVQWADMLEPLPEVEPDIFILDKIHNAMQLRYPGMRHEPEEKRITAPVYDDLEKVLSRIGSAVVDCEDPVLYEKRAAFQRRAGLSEEETDEALLSLRIVFFERHVEPPATLSGFMANEETLISRHEHYVPVGRGALSHDLCLN